MNNGICKQTCASELCGAHSGREREAQKQVLLACAFTGVTELKKGEYKKEPLMAKFCSLPVGISHK